MSGEDCKKVDIPADVLLLLVDAAAAVAAAILATDRFTEVDIVLFFFGYSYCIIFFFGGEWGRGKVIESHWKSWLKILDVFQKKGKYAQ